MIQPKKKICKTCNTEQFLWARSECKFCSSKNYKKINNVSHKQLDTDKILHQIYVQMDANPDKNCFFCGSTTNLSHAHLIRRSENREFIVRKSNIVHACIECHNCWDDNPKERMNLPNADKAMERIELLDFKYYNRLIENSI